MNIECMCAVCHGPLTRTREWVTAIVCGANCREVWQRFQRTGYVTPKFLAMREAHARRRQLALVLGTVAAIAGVDPRRIAA